MFVSELLKDVINQFKQAKISSPVLDAELLISYALDIDRYQLILRDDKKLSSDEIKKIKKIIKRRLKYEPIAYIIGKKEFYSLEFIVNKNVLIPRPETELLVDLVIYYAKQNTSVLDLCTGSGAIAVSVKHNRSDLSVYASDISSKAITIAKKNSKRILGSRNIYFYTGDLFKPFDSMKFDLIVSNPPYVDMGTIENLQKDISYEPEIALFSDDKGKAVIKKIVSDAKKYLTEQGILILEIGTDMDNFIKDIGMKHGFIVSVLNDYANLPRVAVLRRDEGDKKER